MTWACLAAHVTGSGGGHEPVCGQIIVSEQEPPDFIKAMERMHQIDNGSIMIGSTWEEVDSDTEGTLAAHGHMATEAIRLFPFLATVRAIQSWSAVRTTTPDAYPI